MQQNFVWNIHHHSYHFSAYKNTNTVNVVVGVTPSGAISIVSQAYEGSISDQKLTEFSGLLEKFYGHCILITKVLELETSIAWE